MGNGVSRRNAFEIHWPLVKYITIVALVQLGDTKLKKNIWHSISFIRLRFHNIIFNFPRRLYLRVYYYIIRKVCPKNLEILMRQITMREIRAIWSEIKTPLKSRQNEDMYIKIENKNAPFENGPSQAWSKILVLYSQEWMERAKSLAFPDKMMKIARTMT